MRIVAALGGNALLERGESPESSIQEAHVIEAVQALAPLAAGNDLVVTHGNGPQVGMLALESAHDLAISRPYPFDVLGAQTQGMIGYWLVQELQNALPGRQVACLVSRTLVSPDDPAFTHPTKFVGQVYDEQEALALVASQNW
jgi:carbamate kinase